MDVDVVFFDLDETLFDYDKARREATEKIAFHLEKIGVTDVQSFLRAHKVAWRRIYRVYKGTFKMFSRKLRFRETFKILRLDVNDMFLDELEKMYLLNVFKLVEPYPDVKPTLESLRDKKLGVISDGYTAVQMGKIKHLTLEDFFCVYAFSEETVENKPSTRIFRLALRRANCKPGRAVMVGDNVKTDILGGRKAGLKTIWIRRGIFKDVVPSIEEEKPDFVVYRLTEILNVILE